jgi:arabinose-5-phosphate isomerase
MSDAKKTGDSSERPTPQCSPETFLRDFTTVLSLEGTALIKAAQELSSTTPNPKSTQTQKALELLFARLAAGGRIIVSGLGKSGKIAQKIAATLSSTGSPAFYLHPTEALHGDLGMVSPLDVLIAMSQTGKTEELVTLARILRSQTIPVVAVCGQAHSELVRVADAWLDTQVEQEACPHNLAPTTSTTLALAFGDALAVSLMKARGFQAESFAKNHPGGSLGRRLHLRVSDVMERGTRVGTVLEAATMEEVVSALTKHALGAVLVTNGKRLAGLITDGDIRRALQKKEGFFELSAAKIMTASPITLSPDELAFKALEMMENRPSQISVLPVVDPDQNWVGLVRLHDLVRAL